MKLLIVGGVAGGVVAGLTTLAFPAFAGAVVLVGMAAGAFYGAVSGGLLSNEIGITLAVGGGTLGFPQFAVGYKNDFEVFQVTNSNATQTSRFGDYVCNRLIPGGLFAAEVYDVVLNPVPPGVLDDLEHRDRLMLPQHLPIQLSRRSRRSCGSSRTASISSGA